MARPYSYPDSRARSDAFLALRAGQRIGEDMNKLANEFRDEFEPRFGIPTIKPRPNESFDANNDLCMGSDGRTVYHRDGHVSYGGAADALLTYNKRHMKRAAFVEYYGDDHCEEEFAMLHGVS